MNSEIALKTQTKILELKKINEMNNILEWIGNRADHMEERISDLKDRNLEVIQVEVDKELRFF